MDSTMMNVDEREGRFAAALKAGGFRLTHQRLEIIKELARARDHPDADTLFRRVRVRVPTISPDTVYRTVSVLVQKHLVERISMPRATRFDPDLSAHHHFVCDRCGRLEDVPEEMLASPAVPEHLLGIGDVESAHLQLRGICSSCSCSGDTD